MKRNSVRWIGCLVLIAVMLVGNLALTAGAETESAETEVQTLHAHPICGNYCGCGGGHSEVEWEPLPYNPGEISSGCYYLAEDMTLTDTIVITGNVSLCLNDNILSKGGDSQCITVKGNGFLTITDCVGEGRIAQTKSVNAYSSSNNCIRILGNGSLTLYNGTVSSAGFYGIDCYTTGNIQIRGGTVSGAHSGISVGDINDLVISGGTITATKGSAVSCSYSTFHNITVSGGRLEGAEGGLLFNESNTCTGKVTISGGYFYGTGNIPDATTYAGHYYGLSFMSSNGGAMDVTISGGKFRGSRGGIYSYNPDVNLTITNGTFGETVQAGSASYIGICSNAGKLQINGGQVYGLYNYESAQTTINGGEVLWVNQNPTANGYLRVYGGTVGRAGSRTADRAISTTLQNPQSMGYTQIYGGTIVGTDYAVASMATYPILISGGSFSGGIADLYLSYTADAFENAYFSLSGYNGEPLTVAVYGNNADNSYIARNVSRNGLLNLVSTTHSALFIPSNMSVVYHEHSYGEWVEQVDATCISTGIYGYKDCSACGNHCDASGNVLTDLTMPIDSSNHVNTTEHPQQDATCTETGFTAGVYCNDCGTWVSGHELIEAGHSYGDDDICTGCGAQRPLSRGQCGDNVFWEYDGESTIRIFGEGNMYGYRSPWPWKHYEDILTAVVIEEGVTSVGEYAFYSFSNIESITLPETLTKIGQLAFNGNAVTEIDLPEGLQYLGDYAFGNSDFTSIHFGKYVELGRNPIDDTQTLKQITVDPENPYICVVNNVLYTKNMRRLIHYPQTLTQKSFSVPEGVTCIDPFVFSHNKYLTKVELPDSLVELSGHVFYYSSSITDLELPQGLKRIDTSDFSGTAQKIWTIPESVTYIGHCAFSNLRENLYITFEGNAPSLDGQPFYSLTTDVYYPMDNETWTEKVMAQFGGNVNWIPSCGDHALELTYTWAEDYSCCTATYRCTNEGCGFTLPIVSKSTSVTVDATCTEEGNITYTASFDAPLETQVKTVILPVAEHAWDEGVQISNPSLAGPGCRTYTCADCGATKDVDVNGVWQTLNLTEHMQLLPDNVCAGTNLWEMLTHDQYYFTAEEGWTIHSSRMLSSVTIPISAGDRIYAVSFDKAGQNGSAQNGAPVTFFDAEGVLSSMSAAQTYEQFEMNGGCLVAPEGAVAVNITMWSDEEIYILNLEHSFADGSCGHCGQTQFGPVILQQPSDSLAALGETYLVQVRAEGEGLQYQWYVRNAGTRGFSKSSVTSYVYSNKMTEERAGREVYCVITDANGISVKTETVTLVLREREPLQILQQPTDALAALGETYLVQVEASGEGLKYQWYFRNPGATRFTKSSVTSNVYSDKMTSSRAGREVYCVITDAAGDRVVTDTVRLVERIREHVQIVTQPVDGVAALGETYTVQVEATGEGLKYRWYIRNPGAKNFVRSIVTSNVYSDTMTAKRAGREIYCVITDAAGNSVTTDVVTLVRRVREPVKIVTQPTDGIAVLGDTYTVQVEASGEGLKYQWYFRSPGGTRFIKSTVTSSVYSNKMTAWRAGREVYCVITDADGNSVTTDIVKLVEADPITIISQPEDGAAALGETYTVQVEAVGEGLKYQWYFRSPGAEKFTKSTVTTNVYSNVMTAKRAGREVYCVITDSDGNRVVTDHVMLVLIEQ